LLVNDGQDLVSMHFEEMLHSLYSSQKISPLLVVGIHCSADRKNEYGTATCPDYLGRGARAEEYTRFVLEELLPFLHATSPSGSYAETSYAGFSLGGLSAMDIVWRFPRFFSRVGVFSGSFWWRDRAQEDPDFDENTDRIMHRLVRSGTYHPGLKFFFEVGTLDEKADRNNNGIIDSIDDTLALVAELKAKGYDDASIAYLELSDGKHDVATWSRAFPDFLIWGWGN
jgi:enterochelin esterase-like enzyme